MPGSYAGDLAASGEKKLLELAKEGNEYALSELLCGYESFLYGKAAFYRASGMETDDLVQEGKIGFLDAVRHYDPKRGASFRTYAYACMKSRMISAVRSAQRDRRRPLNGCVSLDDSRNAEEAASVKVVNPEDMIVSRETLNAMKDQIIAALTPKERKVLLMYLSGFSYSMMAKNLNVGLKYIDNTLQRMKRKLSLKLAV